MKRSFLSNHSGLSFSVLSLWLLMMALSPCHQCRAALNWEPYTFITLAGANEPGTNDGPGISARFNQPNGITCTPDGTLYVADSGNYLVRQITPEGVVTTIAGAFVPIDSRSIDGKIHDARFAQVNDVAIDAEGNLVVLDALTLRKITLDGADTTVTTVAGAPGPFGGRGDGVNEKAEFIAPHSIVSYGTNTFYLLDGIVSATALRKVTVSGTNWGVLTIPNDFGDFNNSRTLTVDPSGNLVAPNYFCAQIRTRSPKGIYGVLAGDCFIPHHGTNDGLGVSAQFNVPWGAATDSAGNVFVTDGSYNIRKITPSGVTSTLAGTPGTPGEADGTGESAQFQAPRDIVLDAHGNIYLIDGNKIRKGWAPGVTPVVKLNAPSITSNRIKIPFQMITGSATDFVLSRGASPTGPWRNDPTATLTKVVLGYNYYFTATVEPRSTFYRVVTQ